MTVMFTYYYMISVLSLLLVRDFLFNSNKANKESSYTNCWFKMFCFVFDSFDAQARSRSLANITIVVFIALHAVPSEQTTVQLMSQHHLNYKVKPKSCIGRIGFRQLWTKINIGRVILYWPCKCIFFLRAMLLLFQTIT